MYILFIAVLKNSEIYAPLNRNQITIKIISSDFIIIILFKLSVLCCNVMFCGALYSLRETEVFRGRTIDKHCCKVKELHE
jgi:hypothetical protein